MTKTLGSDDGFPNPSHLRNTSKGRLTALASVVVLVALVGSAAGLSLATSQSSPTTSTPLAQLLAPPPTGFTSELQDDQSGTPAGPQMGAQTYAGSTDPDCNFALTNSGGRKSWVATELRYFDKNPTYPSVNLLVCVSQLESSTYARTDAGRETQVLSDIFGSASMSSFAVPEILSATGIVGNVGSTSVIWVIVFKGPYLIVITSQDRRAEEIPARELSVNWAIAEYYRLPT